MMQAESERLTMKKAEQAPTTAEAGMILLDLSFEVIGCDRGALSILNCPNPAGVRPESVPSIPKEILDVIRERKPADWSWATTSFWHGESKYICRAHLIEYKFEYLTQPVVAIHLERVVCASDTISEVAMRYQLTEREQEVLQGISMGLSNEEMADRMNISPNTVRAFVRLIMTKMRVSRRAAIVANVLQNRTGSSEEHATMAAQPWHSSEIDELHAATKTAAAGAGSLARPSAHSSPDSTKRARSIPRV